MTWRTCLLLAAWLWATASLAAAPERGMQARLNALAQAIDNHLAASPGAPAPAAWRKLLWLQLAGSPRPAALVVLRSRRDECAALSTGAQPCRALIFKSGDEGSFSLVAEFALRVHPIALVRGADGVRELLQTRDTGSGPVYGRYRYDGQAFERIDGDLNSDEVQQLPALLVDDRSMPLMADQLYAARQFPNDGARLSPFRLHFDAVAYSARRKNTQLFGSDFDTPVQRAMDALQPDAQGWVAALPWPQTLELRLWSCVDWMVERRFWEVEDRRLGRLGTCVEPALFAARQGLTRSDDANTDLIRVSLLNQVGAAWLLRIAPLNAATRSRLVRPESPAEMQFLGAVAGQWLAHQRRQLSLDRTADALFALTKVADLWFTGYEAGRRRFVTPTPELRAYGASLTQAVRAHQCVRRLAGQPPAKAFPKTGCDAAALESARQITAWLQKDLS